MTIKKKSHSYNQQELKHICDMLCENIEELLTSLDVQDYRMCDKMIIGNCPIHLGDNGSALNLYYEGDYYRGNWKCHTQHCENTFKGSIIGFVRGCLSSQKYNWQKPGDKTVSFSETIEFVKDFLNYKEDKNYTKTIVKKQEKSMFIRAINTISEPIKNPLENTENRIGRELASKSLAIPSQYFIDRGFDRNTLIKYDVGECTNPQKEMYNRAVVPVYDDTGQFLVGCTGRSINEICHQCNSYHEDSMDCPDQYNKYKYSKWRHSKNFKTDNYLYNLWSALENIKQTSTVVLVESPGNVWSLESAGINNSVAIFGSSISQKQKAIIDMTGAMNVILIMDNDEPGKIASEKIYDKFCKTHNVTNILISDPYNDLAEMPSHLIKDLICPQILKVNSK